MTHYPVYPVGLSTCGNKPLDIEALKQMKKSGIDLLELSNSSYEEYDFDRICKDAVSCGLKVWSLHLPFMPFDKLDPSATDPSIRNYTMDYMVSLIRRGSWAGIDKYIIHPSIEPISDDMRIAKLDAAAVFLSELADIAAGYGSVIAVENLPRTCLGKNSAEILYLLAANDKLRVCFDTNHLLSEDISAFIRNVGSKIITTHISDYDFVNERHWLPGEGKADWKAIYTTLTEIGYQGAWLYELGFFPEKTIQRRQLVPQDFTDNARCIFSGHIPAAIGTPSV